MHAPRQVSVHTHTVHRKSTKRIPLNHTRIQQVTYQFLALNGIQYAYIYIYIILGLALSPICWVFDFRALFLYTYNHDPCSVNRPEVNPPRVGLDPKNGCVFFLVSRLHEGHGQVQSQTPGDDADHFSKAFDCNRSARQLNRWEIRPEPM